MDEWVAYRRFIFSVAVAVLILAAVMMVVVFHTNPLKFSGEFARNVRTDQVAESLIWLKNGDFVEDVSGCLIRIKEV